MKEKIIIKKCEMKRALKNENEIFNSKMNKKFRTLMIVHA